MVRQIVEICDATAHNFVYQYRDITRVLLIFCSQDLSELGCTAHGVSLATV